MCTQQKLPPQYASMDSAELRSSIGKLKDRFGKSLCILGHHYQCDEVIAFADVVGDSLKLSQLAAERKDAKYIVFCGVHFMAESADILSEPNQVVILPNLSAGCEMAEMARIDAVEEAFDNIRAMTDARVIPITYVNSSAAIKALTGRLGGACCTSSNARNVFSWALKPAESGGAGAEIVFAIPDQHLGRNTAVDLGFFVDECILYDYQVSNGGLAGGSLSKVKFILWGGHCYVHQKFTTADVRALREKDPDVKIIVHPECPHEVVQLADAAGSTEKIIQAVSSSKPSSKWAIGTESNLVNRLKLRYPDRDISSLAGPPAFCEQMAAIDLPHLLWVLDNLAQGEIINRVHVSSDVASDARIALQRMIDIKA